MSKFKPSYARDDEPFFTLLGRDPAAPHIIRSWAYRRMGQHHMAQQEASKAADVTVHMEPQHPGDEQIRSAFRIADEMESFFRERQSGKVK